MLAKAGFDPFQLRDWRGRWAGYKGDEPATGAYFQPAASPSDYHNFVLDDLLKSLRSVGSITIKEVRITSITGVTARADALVRPQNSDPYLIEVKTGFDPPLTDKQWAVYPLACLGNHAFSPDAKVSEVGLSPGAPLPKMRIMLYYTEGPGKEVVIGNLCDLFKLKRR